MSDEDVMKEVCAFIKRPDFSKVECQPDQEDAWSEYKEMQNKSLNSLQAITLHCSATAATLLGLTALFLPSLQTLRILHILMLIGTSCLFASCLCGIAYNVGAFVLHRKAMRIFFECTIAKREAIPLSARAQGPKWLTPVAIACPILMLLGILSFALSVFVLMI